jgi:hypothetical protein
MRSMMRNGWCLLGMLMLAIFLMAWGANAHACPGDGGVVLSAPVGYAPACQQAAFAPSYGVSYGAVAAAPVYFQQQAVAYAPVGYAPRVAFAPSGGYAQAQAGVGYGAGAQAQAGVGYGGGGRGVSRSFSRSGGGRLFFRRGASVSRSFSRNAGGGGGAAASAQVGY